MNKEKISNALQEFLHGSFDNHIDDSMVYATTCILLRDNNTADIASVGDIDAYDFLKIASQLISVSIQKAKELDMEDVITSMHLLDTALYEIKEIIMSSMENRRKNEIN